MFDKFTTYGLDIDQTMIDGGYSSYLLRQWIKKNHMEKNLHVITFRQDYHYKKAHDDLAKAGLTKDFFKSICNLPNHLSTNYNFRDLIMQYEKAKRFTKIERSLKYYNTSMDTIESLYEELTWWKGKAAAELGCEVLVDDMTHLVKPGCEKYGVIYFHPDDLIDHLDPIYGNT